MSHEINRRSFLKKSVALLGVCYAAPLSIIPDVSPIIPDVLQPCTFIPPTTNTFMLPSEIAAEALALLEKDLTRNVIKPAAQALSNKIDEEALCQLRTF